MIEYENLGKANALLFPDYRQAFEDVLTSGWYVLGGNVKAFEAEFARYCGVNHCVGVASGLDALTIALRCFDLPEGSEVLVPANTYIASILAVLHAGLRPVLVEPDISTYNVDPARIEAAITPETKAIMVVHLYGRVCDMPPILDIARSRGLKVLEDCAQAHGARRGDRRAGAFGDAGAFSFYPTKNLGGLGDGGAITTSDLQIAEKARMYRNYGSARRYENELVGYNSRLDEIQAAFLRKKLARLDEINAHKNVLAGIYRGALPESVIPPAPESDGYHVYHIFNIRTPGRDRLRQSLLERGIKTDIHYPTPPHRQPAMRGILSGDYPVSEEIHATTLSLPVSYFHTREDADQVCEEISHLVNG